MQQRVFIIEQYLKIDKILVGATIRKFYTNCGRNGVLTSEKKNFKR